MEAVQAAGGRGAGLVFQSLPRGTSSAGFSFKLAPFLAGEGEALRLSPRGNPNFGSAQLGRAGGVQSRGAVVSAAGEGRQRRRSHQELLLREGESSSTEGGHGGLELEDVTYGHDASEEVGFDRWRRGEGEDFEVGALGESQRRGNGRGDGGRSEADDDERAYREESAGSPNLRWRTTGENRSLDRGRQGGEGRGYRRELQQVESSSARANGAFVYSSNTRNVSIREQNSYRNREEGNGFRGELKGNVELAEPVVRSKESKTFVERQTSRGREEDNDDDDSENEDEADILERGDVRFDLGCEHFQSCSGCTLEHRLDEPPVLNDARRFFKGQGFDSFRLITGDVWEWRCRAKLAVRGTAETPEIGLFNEGSHRVVDIPSCKAHHPMLNTTAQIVREAVKHVGIRPYNEETGMGSLRYIQMVLTTHNTALPAAHRYHHGKVQLSLVWNARDEKAFESNLLNPLAEEIWRRGGPKSSTPVLHSVWANFQTTRSNVIFGGRWRCLIGEQLMWQRIGSTDVAFTPGSFGQANYKAFEVLLARLHRAVPRGSSVTELYAGTGVIGLTLAVSRSCRRVRCVEVNKACMAPFEQSLQRLPSYAASVVSWHGADASTTPIKWLEGADVVVVDPPRKGLDPPVVDALRLAAVRGEGKVRQPSAAAKERAEKRPWLLRAEANKVGGGVAHEDEDDYDSVWPKTLIYVSCGWEAFKEDAIALTRDDAWHLSKVLAVQFFPGTDSIETLAVFKRGKKPREKNKKAIPGKVRRKWN